jgi:hypothetical protein
LVYGVDNQFSTLYGVKTHSMNVFNSAVNTLCRVPFSEILYVSYRIQRLTQQRSILYCACYAEVTSLMIYMIYVCKGHLMKKRIIFLQK